MNLTIDVPERTLLRLARHLQRSIEVIDAVPDAGIAGQRDERLEVVIDSLRLKSHDNTASELISVVNNDNLLIAAGDVDSAQGSFGV